MLRDKDDKSIIGQMVKGNYPEKTVSTTIGDFKIKYPTGKEAGSIERIKAVQLNGLPRNSFDPGYLNVVNRDCTLAVVISEYPSSFNESWKKENIDEFPNEEVKNSIFKEFNIFFTRTQKDLSKQS